MKKIIPLFCLISIFVGCATVSEPSHKNSFLTKHEGVVLFSTVDDGSTTEFVDMTRRSLRAVFSLGLMEVNGTDDVQIHFSELDSATQTLGEDFYVVHPYVSKEEATKKKWHVLKLKEGTYVFTNLTLKDPAGFRKVKFSKGAYLFKVNAGESVYIGDFKLACKNAPVEDENGRAVTAYVPVPTALNWDMEEAKRKIKEYPNYPTTMTKASIQISPF